MREKNFLLVMDRRIHLFSGRVRKCAVSVSKALTIEPSNQEWPAATQQDVCNYAAKLRSKKVIICLPDGVYKIGFSMVPKNINHDDISCCIAKVAGDFFSEHREKIWLDYFYVRSGKKGEVSASNKHRKVIWVAVPGDRLQTYRILTHKINLYAGRITVSPIVVANALCVLSKFMLGGESRKWLVMTQKSLIYVDIEDSRIQDIYLDSLPEDFCFNRIMSLSLVHEIMKSSNQNMLKGGAVDCSAERYVVGKKIWFQNKQEKTHLRVDEEAYSFLEQHVFIGKEFASALFACRSLCYLLIFGLSMS